MSAVVAVALIEGFVAVILLLVGKLVSDTRREVVKGNGSGQSMISHLLEIKDWQAKHENRHSGLEAQMSEDRKDRNAFERRVLEKLAGM